MEYYSVPPHQGADADGERPPVGRAERTDEHLLLHQLLLPLLLPLLFPLLLLDLLLLLPPLY